MYYNYNRGGMLQRVRGQKNNVSHVYLESLLYNKYELKERVLYGNGSESRYQYDILLRLDSLTAYDGEATPHLLQAVKYNYDAAGNITDITNSANPLSTLGGPYHVDYTYDGLYRMTHAEGWHGSESNFYDMQMGYYPNGRIQHKKLARPNIGCRDCTCIYDNGYNYVSGNRPSRIEPIPIPTEQPGGGLIMPGPGTGSGDPTTVQINYDYSFQWDGAGNMTRQTDNIHNSVRQLSWDAESRLQGVRDNSYLSLYQYDANGERTYKLTGNYTAQNRNGTWRSNYALTNATLYASPYLVATPKGYTKHYYAENERIASKIGMGGLSDLCICFCPCVENIPDSNGVPAEEPQNIADSDIESNSIDCSEEMPCFYEKLNLVNAHYDGVYATCLQEAVFIPEDLLKDLFDYKEIVENEETECYWYHPDHLGSSSWITFTDGSAVQHLHYLPWGEDFVSQRSTNWHTMYTFSAKEKDAETGYSYFGSRYYSSDLSIWLSVDPMSDKYPSLSSYTYCANNPIKLVDPNGEEITSPDGWIVDNTNKTLTWVNDMGGNICQYVGGIATSFKSRSDFINEYVSNGYEINLENYSKPVLNVGGGGSSIQSPPSLSTNDYSKSFFGAASDAYSGSAGGWNSLSKSQQQKISYDLTKSLKNNGYSIQTRQIKGGINSFYSTNVNRGLYAFNAAIDIADFAYSYKVLDGGRFGINSSSSLGGSVGGWGGALIGIKLGVSLGTSVGPYGSLVGGFIGGVAFGFWGSELGSKIGIDTYNSINKK